MHVIEGMGWGERDNQQKEKERFETETLERKSNKIPEGADVILRFLGKWESLGGNSLSFVYPGILLVPTVGGAFWLPPFAAVFFCTYMWGYGFIFSVGPPSFRKPFSF